MVNKKKKSKRRRNQEVTRTIEVKVCPTCSQSLIPLNAEKKLNAEAISNKQELNLSSIQDNQAEKSADKKAKLKDVTDAKPSFEDSDEEPPGVENLGDDRSSIEYNPDLAIPVIQSSSDRYDMSRKKNGCAIFFNFEDFDNYKRFPKRDGSQVDVNRLKEAFQKHDIDISDDRIHKNLTFNSMRDRLREFIDNKSLLSESNALFVVILSHGLEGDMVMAKDTAFNLHDIIKMFMPDEVPEMAARPKVFIVQACRGENIDSGVILKRALLTVDSVDAAEDKPFKYPSFADVCLAMSAHHGHVSFRNANGSWFIQELCDVLETFDLDKNNLLDLLTATNKRVATRSSTAEDIRQDDKKQISGFYSTMTQKFYFKKKLFDYE
uniref:CSON010544 protein n=1 Tax=Culicoides sonorensis TaxID=179676 RepID=A0A336LYG3_CULSO